MRKIKSTRARNARPVVESENMGVPANGSDSGSDSGNATIVATINAAIEAANVETAALSETDQKVRTEAIRIIETDVENWLLLPEEKMSAFLNVLIDDAMNTETAKMPRDECRRLLSLYTGLSAEYSYPAMLIKAAARFNGAPIDAEKEKMRADIVALEKKIASMSTENARKVAETKNAPAPAIDAIGIMISFLTETDGDGRKAFIAALSKVSKVDAPIVGARVPKSLPGLFLELAEMSNPEMYAADAAFKLGNTFGQNLVSLQAKVVNAKPNEKTGLHNDAAMKNINKLNAIQLKSSIARFAFGMMNGSDVGVDIQERARKGGASKIVGAPIANDSAKLNNEVKRKIG